MDDRATNQLDFNPPDTACQAGSGPGGGAEPLVRQAAQNVSELVDSGVVLSSDYGPSGPTYLFNGLNDIKPAMIAEATTAARESAQQFARDAEAKLGSLRRANQGVFQILARDQAPGVSEQQQPVKTVRVVSTFDYYLE